MGIMPLVFYIVAAWFAGAAVARGWAARRRSPNATTDDRIRSSLPTLLNFLAALLIAAGIVRGAGLFFQGDLLTSMNAVAAAIAIGSALDVLTALRYPPAGKPRAARLIAPAAAVVVAGAALGFVLYLRSAPRGGAVAIRLESPVKGRWIAITGGLSSLTNGHHGNPPTQNYAVDLVREDGETEGSEVVAPLDAQVTEAVDGLDPGSQEPEGNLVILKTADGAEIWLAHLKNGSVRVKKGESVIRGQPLAECGSTGSATRAHLHIHAQRGDRAVPLFFGERGVFLVRNDRIVR